MDYTTISKDGILIKDTEFLKAGTQIYNTTGPSTFKVCDKQIRSNTHDYWLKKVRMCRKRRKAKLDELIILKRMAV